MVEIKHRRSVIFMADLTLQLVAFIYCSVDYSLHSQQNMKTSTNLYSPFIYRMVPPSYKLVYNPH